MLVIDSVHRIEQRTGWSISSASSSETGLAVTMVYRHQLQLKFYPASFYIEGESKDSLSQKENTPIELSYCPEKESGPSHARSLSPIMLLILKSLQNHVATIIQSELTSKQLLRFVSEAWDLATKAEEEARMLGFHGVTNLQFSELEKPSLRARCTLLGTVSPPTDSTPLSKSQKRSKENCRIDVDFAVTTCIVARDDGNALGVLDIQTEVIASKVYGFGTDNSKGLSEKEMRSILSKVLRGNSKSGVKFGSGVWSRAVQMLEGRVF